MKARVTVTKEGGGTTIEYALTGAEALPRSVFKATLESLGFQRIENPRPGGEPYWYKSRGAHIPWHCCQRIHFTTTLYWTPATDEKGEPAFERFVAAFKHHAERWGRYRRFVAEVIREEMPESTLDQVEKARAS